MHVTRFAGRTTWEHTLRLTNNANCFHSKMPPTIKVNDAFIDSRGEAILNFFKLKTMFTGRDFFDRMFSCDRDLNRCRGRDRSYAEEENNDS